MTFFITSCATNPSQPGQAGNLLRETFASEDPCSNNARNIGITVGTIGGVLLGRAIGDKNTGAMLAGAGAGALLGGLIGSDIDRKRCELYKIAQSNNLDVTFEELKLEVVPAATATATASTTKSQAYGLSSSFSDRNGENAQFQQGSDEMTERALSYFSAIAQQYVTAPAPTGNSPEERAAQTKLATERRLLLVGHTDDTGSSRGNAELSEKRARKVADFLASRGIPRQQLYFQGAGEGYPVRGNDTEAGRAANRRVEFVEVDSAKNLERFVEARRPNYALYREAQPGSQMMVAPAPAADRAPVTARVSRPVVKPRTAAPVQANGAPASVAPVQAAGPAPASTRAALPSVPVATTAALPSLDFGGVQLTDDTPLIDLGLQKVERSTGSLISSAQASPPFMARCNLDRPRFIGKIKELQGRDFSTAEYLPGLYGTTWAGKVGENLVVLNKVSVLRDGTTPSNLPEVRVYPPSEQGRNARAVYDDRPQVNVYLGANGTLYRMFVGGAQGMQCLDVLFANAASDSARDGRLIYGPTSALLVAKFQPIKRSK